MAALLANPVGMAALVGYGLYRASAAANKWAAEDQARVAARNAAINSVMGSSHTAGAASTWAAHGASAPAGIIPDPTKGSGTGTLTEAEKNAIEARKQAIAKLGEWEIQNAAKVADEVNKARSAETQAGYKTELTILDARHKAFLHTEEVYLAKSRALKVKVIQEQIISAANSVRAYEAKVKSAQDYAESLRGDPGKYLEARRALAQLEADLEKYKKSLRDGKEDLSLLKALFPLEDEARLEKFRREMVALSDSTKRFAENSQFEVSIATLDEDAAGLSRTVEKLRQQMEDYVKAQKLAGTYDPAKFAEFKQEIDKREAAERQAYDGKKALQGDWVSGVKKSFADYAKEAENAFDLGKQAAANAFRSMEDAIVDFVKTGKLSFKSMIDGMIADLVRLVVRMQVTAPLARAFGADMGGAGSIGLGSSLAAIGGTAAIGATMSGPSTASGAAISAGIGLAGVGAQIYTNTVGATMAALQTGVAQAAQQFGMGTVGLSSGFAAEFAALGGETAALGASGGTGVAGTIAGMATAAFAGWAAGIGTFIISILQGESFRMAAAKGVGAGLGAFGGFKAGAAIGATIGGPAGAAIGAAIGTIIGSIGGSWLGSLFGGGSKENQFTLSELVPNMATTFEKEAGFLVSNWQHAANSSETSQWYAPIANAYSDIIGTVQTSFNEQIFDFAEKLPTDLQNMFLAEMAATDFNSLIAEATSGRWGLSGATGALEGIAQKLADSLSTAASTAYFNAFATFLETSSPSALLSSELAGVWDILTSSAQSSVKGIFESASRIMRSDGFEAGAAEMGKATSALAELANALAPITEIIETANLTDYELSLRSINKEFDQYAEALSAAGIDLNKYTDLEKARAIAIRETNQAMVNDYNTVMRDLISQKNILEGTQTPLQIDRLKQSQDMAQFYSEIGQWQLGGYDMLKKIWNLQDIARVKDALSPVKDVLVSIGQTDLQKSMMDLQKWYDEQLGLYQTLRNEGALIGNAYTSALEDLNSAAAYQAQDLISNYIDPITGAWKDFFEGMSTSNLAPVQSMEAFQNRLESLISTADSLEGAQKLQSFVTGEYLPFMQAAAPDYKDVFNDLITSPTSPLNNIKVDLGTVKVDSKAIGDAVAAAIGEAWNGQEINVTINIDGKEIKSSLINLVSSDPDWVMLQGA
jgi:lambda family phage tail tape measure protein